MERHNSSLLEPKPQDSKVLFKKYLKIKEENQDVIKFPIVALPVILQGAILFAL